MNCEFCGKQIIGEPIVITKNVAYGNQDIELTEEFTLNYCNNICKNQDQMIEHMIIYQMPVKSTINHFIKLHGINPIEMEETLNKKCRSCNKTFYETLIKNQG